MEKNQEHCTSVEKKVERQYDFMYLWIKSYQVVITYCQQYSPQFKYEEKLHYVYHFQQIVRLKYSKGLQQFREAKQHNVSCKTEQKCESILASSRDSTLN